MNKLTIKLTSEQQKQIKNATGREVAELSLDQADGQLSDGELDAVAGGLTFTFKLVAVKTISWSND